MPGDFLPSPDADCLPFLVKLVPCTLWAALRHPAPAGCGAAARGELAGFDSSIIFTLLATVRHPAPAGCGSATRGELACFDSSTICSDSALCWPPSGFRLQPGVGQRRGELACFDSSTISTVLAALRHPAPAGCGSAARGELVGFDSYIICTVWAAVRHPAPAGCEPTVGRRRAGSSPASTTPSSALCGPPSGIRLRLGAGRRRAGI
jgi:hypothetical protein